MLYQIILNRIILRPISAHSYREDFSSSTLSIGAGMNNVKVTLVLIYFLVILNNCANSQTTKYYYQLSVNGKSEYVGRYSIDSKIADKVNCYYITLDKAGLIKEIGYFKEGLLSKCPIEQSPMKGVAKIVFPSIGLKEYQDQTAKPAPNWEGVIYCESIFDKSGQEIGIKYLDESRQLMESNRGVAITYIKHDSLGREVSLISVNKNGDTIITADGICEWHQKYGNGDYPIEMTNYDISGNIIAAANGIAIIRMDYDSLDNIIRVTTMDNNRTVKASNVNGCAIVEIKYDNNGNPIERRWYNESNKLKLQNQGEYECAIMRYDYDYPGNCIAKRYYDTNDILRCQQNYNTSGLLTEYSYYDIDGKPCEPEEGGGVFKVRFKYDSLGHFIEKDKYGKDGALKEDYYGIAIVSNEYDIKGNLIRIRLKDVNNDLKIDKSIGYALVEFRFNDENLPEETRFYDQNKNPINIYTNGQGSDSCAVLKYLYNQTGDVIKIIGYDKDGRQTFSKTK
jgi:YD repeat-containing protein